MELLMERSVTKHVRMTPVDAKRLKAIARELGVSESDVLRWGLDEGEAAIQRRNARRKYGHLLVQMAKEVPGPTGKPGRLGFR